MIMGFPFWLAKLRGMSLPPHAPRHWHKKGTLIRLSVCFDVGSLSEIANSMAIETTYKKAMTTVALSACHSFFIGSLSDPFIKGSDTPKTFKQGFVWIELNVCASIESVKISTYMIRAGHKNNYINSS
jgi:hypothetical protein